MRFISKTSTDNTNVIKSTIIIDIIFFVLNTKTSIPIETYVSISCLRISPFCFADTTSEDSKVLIPSLSAAIAKESLVLVEGSSNFNRAKEPRFF